MTNSPSKQIPTTSFGEQLFLLVWAFISSGKDLAVDAIIDLYDHYKNGTSGKKKRLKNKQLYFARLKRQMGIVDESEPQVEMKSSLEDELMSLKMELSNFQKVLPPPPPPPVVKTGPISQEMNSIPTTPLKEVRPLEKSTSNVFEEMKTVQLRSVKMEEKKNFKRKDDHAIFQNSLFAAIQNKFKMVNRDEDSPVATPDKKRQWGSSPKAKELIASSDETEKACENLKNLLDFENPTLNWSPLQPTSRQIV